MTQHYAAAQGRRDDQGLDAAIKFLRQLAADRFFGSIELKFQDGGLAQLVEHRSYKAHELNVRPGSRRLHDEPVQQ
jgi:hypothetical protein